MAVLKKQTFDLIMESPTFSVVEKRADAGMETECKQEEERGRAVESVPFLVLRPALEARF